MIHTHRVILFQRMIKLPSRLTMFTKLIIALVIPFAASAQTNTKVENPPQLSAGEQYVEDIHSASEGNISIDISADILDLIFSDPAPQKRVAIKTQKKEKVSNKGYRVQVFGEAGNQATLQSRCRARGSMVLAKFPKYRGQLYIFSKSPNWYCRIGNFKTSAEASKAAAEIRRAFPQFAGEVRTVKSNIVTK